MFLNTLPANARQLLRQLGQQFLVQPSYHLLRALVYFADADEDESPKMLAAFEWDNAKRFFEAQVIQLTQDL